MPCSPGSHNRWSTAASLAFLSPSLPPLSRLQSVQVRHHLLHHHHPVVSAKTEGEQAAEERVRGRFWGGSCAEHKTPGISSRVSYSTYLPLTPAHPGVTSAICSSMTTVATWLDFTISWVTPFAVSFSRALQVRQNLLKSDVGNFCLSTKCCHFNRTICYCAKSGERETEKGWEKERNSRIKTVNIQGVDRKTGTPYKIMQSNTTAMQTPLEVLLFHL